MSDISYTSAFWDYLNKKGPMPRPSEHGLTPEMAGAIARQCWIELSAQKRAGNRARETVMRPHSSEMGPWSQKPIL